MPYLYQIAKTLMLPFKYVMFSSKSSTHLIDDSDRCSFLVSNGEIYIWGCYPDIGNSSR